MLMKRIFLCPKASFFLNRKCWRWWQILYNNQLTAALALQGGRECDECLTLHKNTHERYASGIFYESTIFWPFRYLCLLLVVTLWFLGSQVSAIGRLSVNLSSDKNETKISWDYGRMGLQLVNLSSIIKMAKWPEKSPSLKVYWILNQSFNKQFLLARFWKIRKVFHIWQLKLRHNSPFTFFTGLENSCFNKL